MDNFLLKCGFLPKRVSFGTNPRELTRRFVPKSGTAIAIPAIPVAPPLQMCVCVTSVGSGMAVPYRSFQIL